MRQFNKSTFITSVFILIVSLFSVTPTVMANQVGHLEGDFTVDPMGSAVYSLPIQTPNGTAGMQAELALQYSSRGGNGLLGVGWNVSGMSTISRCPKTKAQDNVAGFVGFDANDRFCLDGQRLMIHTGSYGVSGSTYRTEVETFQRVTAYGQFGGSPDYFVVEDKAGLKRWYGYMPNTGSRSSRIEMTKVNNSRVTRTWAIAKIEDRFGNHLEFRYKQNSGKTDGEYWPDVVIQYNKNRGYLGQVSFHTTTARTDKRLSRTYGGAKISSTQRLYRIDVYGRVSATGSSTLSRSYFLDYEYGTLDKQSYLKAVQMCSSTTRNSANCTAPSNFYWEHGSRGFSTVKVHDHDVDGHGFIFMDFFGDGSTNDFLEESTYAPVIGRNVIWDLDRSVVVDYDGDGRQDLMMGNGTRWDVLTSKSGTTVQLLSSFRNYYQAGNPIAVDLTRDGLAEIVTRYAGRIYTFKNTPSGLATVPTSSGFYVNQDQKFIPLELDGDGVPELFVSSDKCTSGSCTNSRGILKWNGNGYTKVKTLVSEAKNINFSDINGDGLTDYVTSSNGLLRSYLNNGAGGFTQTSWSVNLGTTINWGGISVNVGGDAFERVKAYDYNRDGIMDLAIPNDHNWSILQSDGDGTFTQINASASQLSTQGEKVGSGFMDYNGDGILDYMFSFADNSWDFGSERDVGVVLGTGKKSGKLKSIVNGLGAGIAFEFKPMTSDVYTGHEGNPAATYGSRAVVGYPIQNLRAPMDLVSKVSTSDGNGGSLETEYRYGGAKQSLDGRGFLGFQSVTALNVNGQTRTTNYHRQDFPYQGMVIRSVQLRSNVAADDGSLPQEPTDPDDPECLPTILNPCGPGEEPPGSLDPVIVPPSPTSPWNLSSGWPIISETTNVVNQVNSIYNRPFPYLYDSFEYHHKLLNNDLVKRIRTYTRYDGTQGRYGCATRVNVYTDNGSGGDLHSSLTTNTFTSTERNMCRLTQTSVQHNRPNYSTGNTAALSLTRKSSFTYDSDKGHLLTETVEPSGVWLKKAYLYDSFGNRTKETITGQGITARSTTTQYDSLGLYPTKTINALGHEESYTWDYKLGTKLSVTGPNGLTTTTQYDAFGKTTKVTSPRTAKYITTLYEWCPSNSLNCGYKVHQKDSAAGNRIVKTITYDDLGRERNIATLSFNGQYAYVAKRYDKVGRLYAESNPYFANPATICWNVKEHDNLGRIKHEINSRDEIECTPSNEVPNYSPFSGNMGQLAFGAGTKHDFDGLKTTTTSRRYTSGYNYVERKVERVTNVMGRVRTVREWDDAGAVIETHYDYDPLGNTTWVKDANGNITRMGYDLRGNKTSMQDPDMGNWTYTYNALGELASQKDANNKTVSMTYDVLGRMKTRIEAEGTTTWWYDNSDLGSSTNYHGTKVIGKVTRVISPGYEKRYVYNNTYGHLYREFELIDGLWRFTDHRQDSYGRPSYLIYPSVHQTSYADGNYRLYLYHDYNAYGFNYRVRYYDRPAATWRVAWQAKATDAFGNITEEDFANGVTEYRSFDRSTGHQEDVLAVKDASLVVDQNYHWDDMGNMLARIDGRLNKREDFTYDKLSRLKVSSLRLSISPTASISRSDSHSYDKIGNLTRKGNSYSSYNYAGAKPHAVKSVVTSSGTRSYSYDANGNMKLQTGGGTYKSVTWTSYNKPSYLYRNSSNRSYFYYAANRARYKQDAYENGKRTITQYAMGGLYEKKTIYNGGGVAYEHHHYIKAGGRVIGLFKKFGSTVQKPQLNFLHKDYQGSVLAMSNASGSVSEFFSYDPWGKRRSHSTWYNSAPTTYLMAVNTKRGYTGHEMLDNVGLIHMNGRIYDQDIGRFLSADPNIQFPESTQGFNRYTYVNNNPMSYNDPSGFFIKGLVAKLVGGWITGVTGQAWLGKLVEGFLSSGGDAKAMLMGQITGGVSNGIAGGINIVTGVGSSMSGILAQGVTAKLQGGSFKDGVKGAAMGMVEGIAQGVVIDAGQKVAGKIRAITASGTDDRNLVGSVGDAVTSGANTISAVDANDVDTLTPAQKAEKFLLSQSEKKGQAWADENGVVAKYDSADEAHMAAAKLYGEAGKLARREVGWHVYEQEDGFIHTFPGLGGKGKKTMKMPPRKRSSLGRIDSSGHVHFDSNDQFSYLDAEYIAANKRTLYLATNDGRLFKGSVSQAKKSYKLVPGSKLRKSYNDFKGTLVGNY